MPFLSQKQLCIFFFIFFFFFIWETKASGCILCRTSACWSQTKSSSGKIRQNCCWCCSTIWVTRKHQEIAVHNYQYLKNDNTLLDSICCAKSVCVCPRVLTDTLALSFCFTRRRCLSLLCSCNTFASLLLTDTGLGRVWSSLLLLALPLPSRTHSCKSDQGCEWQAWCNG